MVKIAVSIPKDVFEAAEEAAERSGLTRSAYYAEALRRAVASRQAIDDAIVEGYRAQPQEHDIDPDALVSMEADLGPYPG